MKISSTLAYLLFVSFLAACVPTGKGPTELQYDEKKIASNPVTSNAVYDVNKSREAYKITVYPIASTQTCTNCHNSHTKNQASIFADTDYVKAHDALMAAKKVDLSTPENSRIYLKVKNEQHNCWSTCEEDAKTILSAIKQWAKLSPVGVSLSGLQTKALPIPADSAATMAQTEYGTILFQAEQSNFVSEVQSGRFSETQDSLALEGKYLSFTPVESNPLTNSPRYINVFESAFNSCKEFDQNDLAPASRAMRVMQAKLHIPSGEKDSNGKVVQDGYRPFMAGVGFMIIRPERRMDYARMIYDANYSNIAGIVMTGGGPVTTATRTIGQKIPDSFQGSRLITQSNLKILPYFVDISTAFNSDGSFKTSGTFLKDDFGQESLYYLFKSGAYAPNDDAMQRGLMQVPNYKTGMLYKKFKETIVSMFYGDNNAKLATAKYAYNSFTKVDVSTYFAPYVSLELRCPAGKVCDNTDYLKYEVVSQTGPMLTQGNALTCYTLSSDRQSLVAAAASNCNGRNPKYFHYIDIFMRPVVTDSFVTGTQTLNYYNSTSPNTYVDLETFTEDVAKKQVFLKDANDEEIDPDVLYTGGSSLVSDADNQRNFNSTLYAALKTTRCIDCHGNPANAGAPQFASSSTATAIGLLKNSNLINFDNPAASFRPNTMVHNCVMTSTDPRYSCTDAAETALKKKLTQAIVDWKNANALSVQDAGQKSFHALSKDERLPGRVKYTFKVTTPGLYNVWIKTKNTANKSTYNFRILDTVGNGVPYSSGDSTTAGNKSCYRWTVSGSTDFWEWSTPGRESELSAIDQRGYVLLDDAKQPLPIPNNRIYFKLSEGTYTLDIISLTEGAKLDAIGINRIEDFKPDSRLMFQPDRRKIDEKSISTYKRKVLRYDLGSLVTFTDSSQSAFFEIEVTKQFNNQNYVFRNPRFITTGKNTNISFKGIKVLINGKWNYPDATYNALTGVSGDNKVLTYAPLVALVQTNSDVISFQFDKLELTSESLTPFDPKGITTDAVEDRHCADVDYFVKNVKPILFSLKVMMSEDLNAFIKQSYPGAPRQDAGEPDSYNCITCHTEKHPYFKMSTFANNDELCREALSRVDFQNFYQSLVVRGINGTGNHPKFVPVEKFVNGSDDNFKVHDLGQDYLSGRYRNQVNIASNLALGPMMVWNKTDLGISKTNYTDLTADEKVKIAQNGLPRRFTPRKINPIVLTYSWYNPEIYSNVLYLSDDSGEMDNILGAYDIVNPDPKIGKLMINRQAGPMIFDIDTFDANGVPVVSKLDSKGRIPFKAGTKQYVANGPDAYDPATLDWISTTPEKDSEAQMWADYESLRDYYREKIISWIRRENAARLKEAP